MASRYRQINKTQQRYKYIIIDYLYVHTTIILYHYI